MSRKNSLIYDADIPGGTGDGAAIHSLIFDCRLRLKISPERGIITMLYELANKRDRETLA